MSFVTVASFETAFEAWLFRNRIAELGLNAIVTNEHIVNTYWLYSNAVGGVQVQIPSSELSAFHSGLTRIPAEVLPVITDDDSDAALPTCPQCGSIEIYRQNWPRRLIFAIWLFLGFPPPIYYPTTRCHDCGYQEHPTLTIPRVPRQFKIIHVIALTTVVAIVLAFSVDLGVDLLDIIVNSVLR